MRIEENMRVRRARRTGRALLVAALVAGHLLMLVPESQAAFPGDNGEIAFWRAGGGLSTVDPDSGTVVELTPGWDRRPAWSPDGTKIAVESTRDGRVDIWVLDADGDPDSARNLTPGAASGSELDQAPNWSPDGTKIVFERWTKGSWDVWVVDVPASPTDSLTPPVRLTNEKADNRAPAWSPTGEWIAFSSDRNGRVPALHLMRSDGTGVRQLTSDPGGGEYRADWKPDGSEIVVNRSNGSRKYPAVNLHRITVNPDGSAGPEVQLTGATGDADVDQAGDSHPAWSPDGTTIAFMSNRAGSWQIFVISAEDGSGVAQLTTCETDVHSPDWRPIVDVSPPAL